MVKKIDKKKINALRNVYYVLNLVFKFAPLYFIYTILFSLVQIATPLNDTLIPKLILDALAAHREVKYIFQFVVLGAVIRFATATIFPLFFEYIVPKYENRLKGKINHLLMEKSAKYDLKLFENSEFYDKYARALNEADVRATGIVASFGGVCNSICYLSTLFVIIVQIDPILILVCVVITITTVLGNKYSSKISYYYDKKSTKIDRFYQYIKRVFYEPQYAKEVRFYRLESFLLPKFENSIEERERLIKRKAKKLIPLQMAISTLRQGVLYTFIIIYITMRIYNGQLTLGDFMALFTAAIQLSSQLSNIGAQFNAFYQHGLYAENLKNVLEYEPNIEEEKEDAVRLEHGGRYDIEVDGIGFKYDVHQIFRNLCLNVRTNEKIAIVGRNGAGKTTLIKLLLRLYDVEDGEIRMNKTPYQRIAVGDLRKKIGIVFQDMQFLALSIAENILLRPLETKEDEELVCSALNKVGLLEKVLALPKGIHSVLTKEFDEEGVLFSGGEMQKLALARVFASDCNIVILDEPSSALDPISEKEMFDFMFQATVDKTMILITHRLSSVKMADIIYFVENGLIIESGTHNQLMRKRGKYYEMFQLQAENYRREEVN